MASDRVSRRPPTVQEVAKAAGVSKATAARVLGGYGAVGGGVRARVQLAAEALGYQPNEIARSMSTGRSGTIGVVVGDIQNPYFGLAVRGVSDAAKDLGLQVILANSAEDSREERAAVDVLMRKQIDGLIVAPAAAGDIGHLRDFLHAGRPLVLIDRSVPALSVDTVTMNDAAAAREATERLLALGHRRLAYLTATRLDAPAYAPSVLLDLSTVSSRIAGFAEALLDAGLSDPYAAVEFGLGGAGRELRLSSLLHSRRRPTAILASDSLIALDVLRAARAAGLSIPRDLSLVTFHDADWTSAVSPAISVIAQPAYQLGQEAVRLLGSRFAGEVGAARRLELPMRLILRESVAPPQPQPHPLATAGELE
ncbi:MAG: LacI family transcriptional regulator [Proteobacteria bacterium]|nr:LacI family transcriptional regulator [Pseudomonadota bacterium]